MPSEDRVDKATLDAVAAQLDRSIAAALDASHELLAHYADTGDASVQRTVDTLIDHAAVALGSLTESLADTSRGLKAAAGRATTVQSAEASTTHSDRRRDHFA